MRTSEPSAKPPIKTEGKPSRSGTGLAKAYGDLGKEAFQQGKLSEAIARYKEALQLDPRSPELHTDMGLILIKQGKLEDAATHLTEALKLNPGDKTAEENLDLVLAKLGRPQKNLEAASTAT